MLGLKQTGKEKLQLLKNAAGGDKTAVQKLADQAISLGQFPDTEEGRKQAFEYFVEALVIYLDLQWQIE